MLKSRTLIIANTIVNAILIALLATQHPKHHVFLISAVVFINTVTFVTIVHNEYRENHKK